MRASVLTIEFFMACVVIIYSILGYQLYSNWKVIESILLTKVVNTVKNKGDNLENYVVWLIGALTSGVVASTASLIFGILFIVTENRPVYITAVFIFFILFIALLTVGIFANNNIADDIITFDIIGQIVTKDQSTTFRYGPVLANYLSSGVCLIISAMTYVYMPPMMSLIGGKRR
jgi:hypothetical protein